MGTSYHTNADDLREGTPREDAQFHEPRAEAPSPAAHFTALHIGQTGDMPRLVLEADELPNDRERSALAVETSALPLREATMSVNDPILIVEDTVELAEVIEATIQGMGLPVIVANHGSIALERLKTVSPRLLLLDLGLPDISGWEILKTIKEVYREQNRTVPPIIVITAYGDPANRLIGKFQEVNAYLIKPFTPEQVEKTVNTILNAVT